MSDIIRKHVFVSGRVQGVGFRATARNKAQSLNVNGWVKNLYDGRVEAVIEGEPDAVKQMTRFFKKGPRMANVTDYEIKDETPTNNFSTFSVKY
ncbi:MAG: acylphosphatase [Halanaerobiales bacterium]|nr:acylphosphatase [Halanaerobiales bacterium]